MTKGPSQRDRALLTFKNVARGATKPRNAISTARLDLPLEVVGQAAAWLETAAPKGQRIRSDPYPSTPHLLRRNPRLDPLPPDLEFLWALERLCLHADKLGHFFNRTRILSQQVLASQYADALQQLDELEAALGYSLWVIKLRLALLERVQGFESQKRYMLSILDEKTDSLVRYIAQWDSIRNESALSPGSFRTLYTRQVSEITLPPDLQEYVTFHILPPSKITPGVAAHVLNFEDSGSVIDLYDTATRLGPPLLSHSTQCESYPWILRAITRLLKRVPDPRLASLRASSLNNWDDALITRADQRMLSAFISGQYSIAQADAENLLAANPNDCDLISILARSHAARGEARDFESNGPLWSDIAQMMSKVLLFPGDGNSWAGLQRLALNYDMLPMSDFILGFLDDETADAVRAQASHFSPGAISFPTTLNPLHAPSLPKPTAEAYLKSCRASYGETSAIYFAELLMGHVPDPVPDLDIAPEILQIARAEQAVKHRDFTLAQSLSSQGSASSSRYFSNRMIRLQVTSLIELGEIADCIDYVTRLYRGDNSLYILLPVQLLARNLEKPARVALRAQMSLPILFEIHSRYNGPSLDTLLRSTYQQFLAAHGLSRPSEISRIASRFELSELVYFLHKVCVSHVIDSSRALRTSADVQNERIAICQLLTTLDSVNTESYQAEIKNVTTTQAVQAGLVQMELAKIYVDLDGVRQAADKTLRESFARYRVYQHTRVEHLIKEIVSALQSAQRSNGDQVVFRVRGSDGVEIMDAMIKGLRDEFISSTQYGLDGYLSLRIRHGILQGHLRSPVERNKLITQREASSSRYRTNKYWEEELKTLPEHTRDTILSALASFSQQFDALVAKVREWIRLRRAEEDSGLFDFRITAADCDAISNALSATPTFEEFVELTLDLFWKRLESSVETVRRSILEKGKQDFDALLERLQRDITNILANRVDHGLLNAIINAKTEMQQSVNRMAEWFQLPTQTSNFPFPLSLAVHVAADTANRFHPGYRLTVHCHATADPEYPRSRWATFVDVFLILFENVHKYAGFSDSCEVTVEITQSVGEIIISVYNLVRNGSRSLEANERIDGIRTVIDSGRFLERIAQEDGSGFCKIAKIIGKNFDPVEGMSFGFDGDAFRVKIVMGAG